MRNIVLIIGLACLISGCTSIKLAIPDKFKEQATMEHVKGANRKKMSFANFSTSKIKRGVHVISPVWSWERGSGFLLENMVLNQIGIQKNEPTTQEKTKFRFTLSDGRNKVQVYAHEREMIQKTDYEIINRPSILDGFEILQKYKYIFSAIISADTTQHNKTWELLMTNIYDRKAANDKNPFTFVKPDDNGLATNGIDTIFIKPLSIKKTALSNGKTGQLPFKLLSGYELSTNDGVIAIIDLLDRNIWFYNELGATERLNIGAIATAIFARKIHDVKW